MFTDNDPLNYVLSSAKLNATSLRWIGELTDFNLLYTIAQEKPMLMPTRMPSEDTAYTEIVTQDVLQAIVFSAKSQD